MTIFTAEEKRIMTMTKQELIADGSAAAILELARSGCDAQGNLQGHTVYADMINSRAI